VARVLQDFNQESKTELSQYVVSQIPLQFKDSITLLRRVISVADQIQQTSKLESIKLGALDLMVSCNQQINLLYADSKSLGETIDNALSSKEHTSNI